MQMYICIIIFVINLVLVCYSSRPTHRDTDNQYICCTWFSMPRELIYTFLQKMSDVVVLVIISRYDLTGARMVWFNAGDAERYLKLIEAGSFALVSRGKSLFFNSG